MASLSRRTVAAKLHAASPEGVWHTGRARRLLRAAAQRRNASASNYMVSVESMCKTLDIKLNEIPDWNCCGASIGYAEGGELPRHVMNARNIALSEKNFGNQDIVATCAACWLGAKEPQERINHSSTLMGDIKVCQSQ